MPAEYDHMVRFIPDAPISDDTELAFIEGVSFVNAAKHEYVVAGHCNRADRLAAENERLREAIKIALSGYPRYSSIGGINNTVTLQFDRTRYERMRQLAQNRPAPSREDADA